MKTPRQQQLKAVHVSIAELGDTSVGDEMDQQQFNSAKDLQHIFTRLHCYPLTLQQLT